MRGLRSTNIELCPPQFTNLLRTFEKARRRTQCIRISIAKRQGLLLPEAYFDELTKDVKSVLLDFEVYLYQNGRPSRDKSIKILNIR